MSATEVYFITLSLNNGIMGKTVIVNVFVVQALRWKKIEIHFMLVFFFF